MLPRFLIAVASLLFLLGLSADVASAALTELGIEASDACQCCPDGDEDQGEGEGDCCDWDFGACCAPGTAAALSTVETPQATRVTAPPQACAFLPPHLLRPRDNGPPPTPPPIG